MPEPNTTLTDADPHADTNPHASRPVPHAAARRAFALLAGMLALTGLTACGNSSPNPATTTGSSSSETTAAATLSGSNSNLDGINTAGTTVAKVGPYTVTTATIDDWMTPILGEDFYTVTSHQAPTGLIAHPPDYTTCTTALKTLAGGTPPKSTTTPKTRCQDLYEAIRYQTATYLITGYSNLDYAAHHHIIVTNQELAHRLNEIKANYQTTARFNTYLATYSRTLPQELFLVKLQLLQEKLIPSAQLNSPATAPAIIKRAHELNTRATASCTPEYNVEHCKNHNPTQSYPGEAPNTQITQITNQQTPSPTN